MTDRTCSVDGCTTSARSGGAELCSKHYFRQYRHGDPLAVYWDQAVRVTHGRRYKSAYLPDHPLSMKNGKVYVHRAVLFDVIGFGPHLCHWCGTPLTWGGTSSTSLAVDHLDGFGDNNDPGNLVPSCPACNAGRGIHLKQAANSGRWWNGDGAAAVLRTLSRSGTS